MLIVNHCTCSGRSSRRRGSGSICPSTSQPRRRKALSHRASSVHSSSSASRSMSRSVPPRAWPITCSSGKERGGGGGGGGWGVGDRQLFGDDRAHLDDLEVASLHLAEGMQVVIAPVGIRRAGDVPVRAVVRYEHPVLLQRFQDHPYLGRERG